MAKTVKIPAMEELNRMTLDELNNEINRLAKVANDRIYKLEKSGSKQAQSAVTYFKMEIGEAQPSKANSAGMANRFSRAKSKSRGQALKRLSAITYVLKSKRSTLSGLAGIDKQRLETFERKYGFKFKNNSEYQDLVNVLSKSTNFANLSSDQVLDVMVNEIESQKFANISSLIKFLEERSQNSIVTMEYADIKGKGIRYNKVTGKFENERGEEV